ncbi:hypothetical protein AZE42_11804 [Rhizopogon vesiculosus]|uniref:Uncharacterized protein n=1 Tax=Rhizopogon vesiculosus TaxID=180088 RepID=A0A1J8R344_9AGAM|nr:hypothetical protein AZE42_11804 [Rhizopogon vesiculosus]
MKVLLLAGYETTSSELFILDLHHIGQLSVCSQSYVGIV